MLKTSILRLGMARVLRLPPDPVRVEQLRGKLNEYVRRGSHEARYKALVLGKLLADGEASTNDLALHVAAEVGPSFDRRLFTECCNVIDDYCTTGGVRTVLGSGLAGLRDPGQPPH